jgi:hypothetical protein
VEVATVVLAADGAELSLAGVLVAWLSFAGASMIWISCLGLLDELPGLHDLDEPGVERLWGGDFVEKAPVQEPYLPRSAHRGIGAEEFRRRNVVDGGVLRIVHDAGGFVHQERCLRYLGLVVGSDENLKSLAARRVFEQNDY